MPVNRTITPISEVDAAQVVTLEEAKDHLRLTGDDQLDRIAGEIDSAISWAEDLTARAIRRSQYLLSMETFQVIDHRQSIRIQGFVSSVDSIKYKDSSGTLQTVSTSVYQTLKGQHSTMIREAANQSWPALHQFMDALQVTFTAGWVSSDVPFQIRQAILLKLGSFHFVRAPGDSDDANIVIGRGVDIAAQALLKPWQLPVW
jgi:uncharacterized phiE125 gp8 family phage protein